ncbi:hypothetical protein Pmani_034632 [Petrolisthes manimaculis]|uniref:Guanine nucleotide-binding protein subunit beta-like protein 1 n=1 Tax=Petrolisthes manimaculis TaxID=1843537 RepID=A0AAE1TPH4_9EUCA|nr:hypothetical protein Pmani_034632 [Petrolisthes manimaculis]
MSAPPPDPVFVFRGACGPVTSLTFIEPYHDQNVQMLAAGTQNGYVLIWDVQMKCLLLKWSAGAGESSTIQWLYNETPKHLWTQVRYEGVKIWDMTAHPPVVMAEFSLEGYLGFGQSEVSVNYGRKLLSIPGPGQEGVSVWDVKKRYKICSLLPAETKRRGSLMQTRWVDVAGQVRLVAVYESGHLSLWDWKTSTISGECQVGENTICFTYHNTRRLGIVGTTSEKVYIVTINDDLAINTIQEITITNPGLSCCVVRPDGKLYVTGGWDSRIRIFSSREHKPIAVLQYHKKTVECLAYSVWDVNLSTGCLLAAGSSDKSISLWNIFT